VKIDFAAYEDWPKIKALLREAGLPHEDIKTPQLKHFLLIRDGERVSGVAGLELYGSAALLRFLAVAPDYRRFGFASNLLAKIEEYAKARGAEALYLLAETAGGFFEKRGYRKIDWEVVPAVIRETPEFGGLCPSRAECLVRHLD
jgi:amino-acid N-acetyltransferase